MSVLMPTEVQLDKLVYHTPIKEKGYHKSIITYSDKIKEVILQTPPLELKGLNDGFELKITKNKKQANFYTILRSLEHVSINTMTNNSESWFGKNIPQNKLKSMFRSCLYSPDTINGEFTLRLKKDKHIQIYNSKKQLTTIDEIKPEDNLLCLLKINGILFGKNTSKLDIRIVQIRVCPEPTKLPQGCNVNNDSDEESVSDYDSDMDNDFNFTRTVPNVVPNVVHKSEEIEEIDDNVRKVDYVIPESLAKMQELDIQKNDHESFPEPVVESIVDSVISAVTSVMSGGEEEEEEIVQPIIDSDFDAILKNLRVKMANAASDGDLRRIEEIACEIVQLKASK
jgi:hypothetical protein